jgi:hypothetical protein
MPVLLGLLILSAAGLRKGFERFGGRPATFDFHPEKASVKLS